MYFLFVKSHDPCGDGVRGDLEEFTLIQAAHERNIQLIDNDKDVIQVTLIEGTVIEQWEANETDEGLPSSEEILKVSKLTDIDDLENKENV